MHGATIKISRNCFKISLEIFRGTNICRTCCARSPDQAIDFGLINHTASGFLMLAYAVTQIETVSETSRVADRPCPM